MNDEKQIEKYNIPERSRGDIAHIAVKSMLSAIPAIGGPAAELFAAIIIPPLEKRRDEWMNSVAEALREFEKKGLNIDRLKGNEQFVSILMDATRSAVRDHKAEKREALRNAVLNVASGTTRLSDDQQMIFLSLIDRFTPWHLRILRLFQNPLELSKQKGLTPDKYYAGSRTQLLEEYYPDMKGQGQFYSILVSDLRSNGMLGADLSGMLTSNGMFQKITTEWGDQFISFISSPL